jgi:excisionase family DNA binding protein
MQSNLPHDRIAVKLKADEKAAIPSRSRTGYAGGRGNVYKRSAPSVARTTVRHLDEKPPDANPDLWTLTQSADYLDVSRKQLLDLIRQGDLRYVQRGLRIRIHREELERYRERLPE